MFSVLTITEKDTGLRSFKVTNDKDIVIPIIGEDEGEAERNANNIAAALNKHADSLITINTKINAFLNEKGFDPNISIWERCQLKKLNKQTPRTLSDLIAQCLTAITHS